VPGSLCLAGGVLYVGRHAKTAHVQLFDMNGRELPGGFSFRDPERARSEASDLVVDDDRRIWVADTPAHRVRAFNLFGVEIDALAADPRELERRRSPASERDAGDAAGVPAAPAALALWPGYGGVEERLALVVGSGGRRRHGVQVFDLESKRLLGSLRPEGRADGFFRGVRSLSVCGRRLYVCELGRRAVQVFRNDAFHFSLDPLARLRAPEGLETTAVEELASGRLLWLQGGRESALRLLEADGREVRRIAGHGAGDGELIDPSALVVAPGDEEHRTRVAVIDREGDRIQVFSLQGHCLGAFEGLAG